MPAMAYIGRFAPSPSGPLHAGSLVAAVASYLDARAHQGTWLIRIEDIDEVRTAPGAAQDIIATLRAFGMEADGEIVWQSRRKELYQAAFDRLAAHAYPCGCNRREIADSRLGLAADGAALYPGVCRDGVPPGRPARSLRVRVPEPGQDLIVFTDRLSGEMRQQLAAESGDFVLRRADGYWAYQLAVVVDDALQGITDVVRGADLLDSTPRQVYLQHLLGYPTPRYLHVPVLRSATGEKLSKQTGALSIAPGNAVAAVEALLVAAHFLGLPMQRAQSVDAFWKAAIDDWAELLDLRGV
ncbi:tRNA glutamyl-Q(34) synthetase GluQRS [Massilia sp. S19_KUP03_FR1]|uniref:tRNA glutamyl-Q(34) synthetase GluQRS n=1 Tax=Massilia sp. S19_KUP03_FR1 TaxID=3025503 RepID=UPI002FCCBE5B